MANARVKGKNIRGQGFYNSLYAVAAAGIAFLLTFLLPTKYRLIGVSVAGGLLLYFSLRLLLFKKVLCVFTEDRLYYYGMEFAVISGKKRKVLSDVGSVLFADIKDYKYLPGTWFSKSFAVPCRVILYGADFELTVTGGGKHLIRQLENAQMSCIGRDPAETGTPDAGTAQQVRHGLWKEIWNSFESGELENVLGEYTILLLEGNESLDVIDIAVEHNGHEIAFNLDESSVYLYAVDTQKTQTVTYEHLSDLEAFFLTIRNFIASNS